jgi:hypothetical protein
MKRLLIVLGVIAMLLIGRALGAHVPELDL